MKLDPDKRLKLRRDLMGIIHDEVTVDCASALVTSKTLDRIMARIARAYA